MKDVLKTGQKTGQPHPTVCIQSDDEAFLVLRST